MVSYGGSSLLSTLIIFAVIQGLYLMREREQDEPRGKTGLKGDKHTKEKKLKENIINEKKPKEKKRPKKKGGISSHEETIHGTKIQDFD